MVTPLTEGSAGSAREIYPWEQIPIDIADNPVIFTRLKDASRTMEAARQSGHSEDSLRWLQNTLASQLRNLLELANEDAVLRGRPLVARNIDLLVSHKKPADTPCDFMSDAV
ncbi:MAG: hypothetical protein Q4F02_03765 [Candidatus Saccharibacteria bacterium]|nr:hypothetical protein [Candidatus Saccharibacteria bacterium]